MVQVMIKLVIANTLKVLPLLSLVVLKLAFDISSLVDINSSMSFHEMSFALNFTLDIINYAQFRYAKKAHK